MSERSSPEIARTPKVRTSHRRNKEEAERLQKLVDERIAADKARSSPETETPVVKSFAGSTKDNRCLEVWFAGEVTDATRAWLLEAINEKALRACTSEENCILEEVTDELLAHGEFSSGSNNRSNAREAARVVIDMVRKSSHAQSPGVDLMQRVWANLYYNEEDAGNTFQQTLNEVVDWLAERNALPKVADSSTVLTSAPLDPNTPECSFCGARIYDPCRTLERANHCELPPGVAVSSPVCTSGEGK